MKNKLILLLAASVMYACSDFLDINDDPNNASESSLALTLAPGISGSAYVLGGSFQILGGMWSQHWTQSTGASQYRNIDQYDVTAGNFDTQYSTLYAESLNDLEYVKNRAAREGEWNYYLIATVMQSYTFQVVADLYDKAPFTEALKSNANFLPRFDDGQVIYDSLVSRIDYALSMDRSANTLRVPGNDDLLFGGDMEAWVAFANTLKLKLYLRESFARPAEASAGIAALFSDPEVTFLDQHAAMTQFSTGQNQRNPYYETQVDFRGHVDVVASNTLMEFLQSTGDPRLNQIFDQVSGAFVGLDQGDFFAPAPVNATGSSQPIVSPTDPVYFVSEAESYFLQAEAILRFPTETGGTDADARALYEQGIEASFAKFGTASTPALYGAGGAYEWAGTQDEKLELIIVQKWIAMANSQGLESHFEQLRTGYPDFFVQSVNSVLGAGQFPRRLLFPGIESNRNPDNVPALVPLNTRVWWDID